MDFAKLKNDLLRDENIKLQPYKDSEGHLTIGIGRNLDANGITAAEALDLLDGDILRVTLELDAEMPWWRALPGGVQCALANMAFNMGLPSLKRFRKMLAALQQRRFPDAAREALDSKWARQVGERAVRIAAIIASGE